MSNKETACEKSCYGSALRLAQSTCNVALLSQPDGVLDPLTQICQCASVPLLTYCGPTCLANHSVVTLSLDGSIGIVNRGQALGAAVSTSQLTSKYGLFAPQMACKNQDGCQVLSIVAGSNGHRALIDLPPTLATLTGMRTNTATFCNYSSLVDANGAVKFAYEEKFDLESEQHADHHATFFSSLGPFTMADSKTKRAEGRIAAAAEARERHFRALDTSAVNPYQVAPTLDYLQTLVGYYNPTLCLQQGETVFWQIDDAAHYPVYQKDNFLNSNPDFDYGVFEQLASQLAVGASIQTFAFTFFTIGTYVFADAANEAHQTIIAVLDINHPCPSGNKILPTSSASLNPLGVGTIVTPVTKPDLTLIWALLGVFLGMVLIIAIVAKLKQKRAVRALELAAEDDSMARNDFKQLYLEIREQKKSQKNMFNKQRDHFRSECDRICAETEQVKALLATKMTDGRGFVDAAINLLLQELTARNSYGNRQNRREEDMFSILMTLQRMLTDATGLEDPMQIATAQLTEQVDIVATKVGDVIREAEKERARKRHLQSNAGIIGDEIIKKLTEHSFNEENRENAFLAKLKVFRTQCVEYKTQISDMQNELDEKVKVLKDRRNMPAIETAQIKFQRRVKDMADGLNIDLERLLGMLEAVHNDLKAAREETVEDENEALESLEQRKLDVEARQQTGIFAGLDEELAAAIKLFLGQARRELLPLNAGFDMNSTMGGGMMLGRGFGQGEFGSGMPGGGKRGEGQQPGGADQPAEMAPSEMVEQAAAEMAQQQDEEAERQRRAALENVEAMNVDELRQLYADLRQKEEMMEKLQRAEEERQKRLAEELLKSAELEPEDEMLLGKARELLDNMVDQHRREEEELHSKLKADEEVRIAAEIAALESVEKTIDRKKADLALEMARRNEQAASESEKTEIAHEHQVQLKSLEESLRADKINSQKVLSKIHEDMRSKLRESKKKMREKQKNEETEVRGEFERVKEEVEAKLEEKSVKIEGIDLRALEKQLHDGIAAAPSAKQQALANFHLQTQQELQKKQQADERKLVEETEKERQRELDLLEKQFQERKTAELLEMETKLKQERDSLGDEEQAKALMLQHANQLAALGHELDAERARQKQHLNAALARKRKLKEQKLKAEHELEMEKEILEQKKEMDSHEKANMKKKEIEALGQILTKENYRKAKAIIEKIIKPRQHKEVSGLIQDNFKEAALALSENLDKAMTTSTMHREDVERRLALNEITFDDAQHELQLIEEEVNPDIIKSQTLQYLEPQQNEKLTLQKKNHFQEIKDIMKRFYPSEQFDGAEWTMEETTVNVASLLKEAEERKKKQDELYAEQLKELERREQEQLKELERLKAEQMAALEAKMAEDNRRMQAEFEAQLQAKKAEFEAQQRLETEKAVAAEMALLEAREAELLRQVEEAKSKVLSQEQTLALEKEQAAIESEKNALMTEAEQQQRESAKQHELELERQRKKNANKQLLREQEIKLEAMNKLEEEHAKNIEQQKKNLAASSEKLKKQSEEAEQKKKDIINLAARAFVRFGRQYSDHRALGIRNAVRRIRKVYDKARLKGIPFGLVPGPAAGTMLQVPLQPGMPLIGGGGAIAGEGGIGIPGAAGGAGGVLSPGAFASGMMGAFPGAGESGQPFFNKLEKIENQLTKMMKTGNDGLFAPDLLPYFAPGEEALVCEGKSIEELPISALTPKKFVLYRFGLFILDFLAEAHSCATIRLLFSKSLPAKPDAQKYAENAFKNSFHFDPLSRTLFVRVERTEEVGEFTLLLVHVLSHVLAQTWSDAHPRFQEYFHRSLQYICSELFFARTKKGLGGFGAAASSSAASTSAQRHTSSLLSPSGSSSLETLLSPTEDALSYKEFRDLFGLVSKLEFKEDLVGEFLDLQGVSDHQSGFFSEDQLIQRMESYKLYNASGPLKDYLRDLEKTVGSKQETAVRDTLQPKERGMLEPKLGDKPTTSKRSSMAKESVSLREKNRAQVERLLEESDQLHTQLLGLISAMSPVSESLIAAQEAVERLQSTKSKDAQTLAALAEAQAHRRTVQAKLKRLNIQKTAVNQRIEDVETSYKQKMAEVGGK